MKKRILAGLTGAILLILLIFYGPMLAILLVCVSAAAMAYLEFDRLFFGARSTIRVAQMVTLIVIALVFLSQNQMLGWLSLWFAFIVLALGKVIRANRLGDFSVATRELALEVLAFIYIVGLFGFLYPIAEQGRNYLFLLFFLVFIGDTAAYFVGARFGKRLLVSKLSPKKTVEGAAAAILFSTLATFGCVILLFQKGDNSAFMIRLMLFAPVGSMLAQFGDLFESLLKRSQAQKDSGTFLPGHGGMLDRVDGLALIAPVYYIYLRLVLEKVS